MTNENLPDMDNILRSGQEDGPVEHTEESEGLSNQDYEIPTDIANAIKDKHGMGSTFDYEGEIGGVDILPRPDVDLMLYPIDNVILFG